MKTLFQQQKNWLPWLAAAQSQQQLLQQLQACLSEPQQTLIQSIHIDEHKKLWIFTPHAAGATRLRLAQQLLLPIAQASGAEHIEIKITPTSVEDIVSTRSYMRQAPDESTLRQLQALYETAQTEHEDSFANSLARLIKTIGKH